jgi:hypothetical protein
VCIVCMSKNNMYSVSFNELTCLLLDFIIDKGAFTSLVYQSSILLLLFKTISEC